MTWLAGLFAEGGAAATEASAIGGYGTAAAAGSSFVEAAPWTFGAEAPGTFAGATAATSGTTAGSVLNYIGQGATLLQGVSGYASGQQNSAYLEAAGKNALRVGAANKNLSDARGRAQLGELRAQMGAQGTTISGSPMLVYLDSVRNAALESATEYYKGQIQSQSYKQQAKVARMGGTADLWSGIIGATMPSKASLGSRLLAELNSSRLTP